MGGKSYDGDDLELEIERFVDAEVSITVGEKGKALKKSNEEFKFCSQCMHSAKLNIDPLIHYSNT